MLTVCKTNAAAMAAWQQQEKCLVPKCTASYAQPPFIIARGLLVWGRLQNFQFFWLLSGWFF